MDSKLTLSELNSKVKNALADAFPTFVWVVAEISELKENRSGHCYLELIEKENNEIIARSRATIWSYTYRMLKPYFETTTGEYFDAGIKILVKVSIEFHPSFGMSLNIKDIDPTYTVGDLALQRKEIINRLQSEGILGMNKEIELPLVPQKIAVISSATAAGYEDFLNQLENNSYGIKFYTRLFEAFMQGAETVPSIINALEKIFQYDDFFDAVVIIRGGGATADLSSFDSYELAANVTQFPLPVITGIGHEKDDTVIDLVAHTRLKTPTAVAEFFINGAAAFLDHLYETENEIVQMVRNKLDTEAKNMENFANGLNYSVTDFIGRNQQNLNKKGSELLQHVNRFVFNKENELNQMKYYLDAVVSLGMAEQKNQIAIKQRILKRVVGEVILKKQMKNNHLKDLAVNATQKIIFGENERIKRNQNSIRLLNPENVLKRGYTLTLSDGKIIKSAKQLQVSDEIETQFTDGRIKSKITKKR